MRCTRTTMWQLLYPISILWGKKIDKYRSYEEFTTPYAPPIHPLYIPYTSYIPYTTPPLHHSTTPPLHRDLLIFARNEGADCVNALDVMANGQDSVLEALKFGLGDGYLQVCVCVCWCLCMCVCVCACMCVYVCVGVVYTLFVCTLSLLYTIPVTCLYPLYTIYYTRLYSLYLSIFTLPVSIPIHYYPP